MEHPIVYRVYDTKKKKYWDTDKSQYWANITGAKNAWNMRKYYMLGPNAPNFNDQARFTIHSFNLTYRQQEK